MPVNIFERRWLAASDARYFIKGEGFIVDPANPDFAHRGKMKICMRLRDGRWYYWYHLKEERPSRPYKPRPKKVEVSI